MKTISPLHYFLNCMLLLLPVMIWNVIFADRLPRLYSPEVFDKDIPTFIIFGENVLRLIVFVLPLLMPLRIETPVQKIGLAFYIAGVVIYFFSWLAQMYFPQSPWSLSAIGSLAPAYTPLIWLVGIGLIGNKFYFPFPYRSWMYITPSFVFLSFHLSHATLVYYRSL